MVQRFYLLFQSFTLYHTISKRRVPEMNYGGYLYIYLELYYAHAKKRFNILQHFIEKFCKSLTTFASFYVLSIEISQFSSMSTFVRLQGLALNNNLDIQHINTSNWDKVMDVAFKKVLLSFIHRAPSKKINHMALSFGLL